MRYLVPRTIISMLTVAAALSGGDTARAAARCGAETNAIAVSDTTAIARRWGVRVETVRLTAAGYMLDLRYQVLDAVKAKPLFVRKTKPVLRAERSGLETGVLTPPKTGPLRNSNDPKAGRSYFIVFPNPGREIAAGDAVTLAIGDFRVCGLQVE
jgi:hypothetical protein